MTAKIALEVGKACPPWERAARQTVCMTRGGCLREPLVPDAGRWTWCRQCTTVYDDYGVPVNAPTVH